MWLRNILGRMLSGRKAPPVLAMTVEKRPGSPSYKAFGEFSVPAKRQRGGSLRLGARHLDQLGRIGIIPAAGVKVP